MKKLKTVFAILLMATSFVGKAQDQPSMPKHSENPKLIAVINRANWCRICKENGQRFGALIMPYTVAGVNIYVNDLTDETTKASSKVELEKADVYEAATTIPRKGMGRMLKSCGLAKDKKMSTDVSGIVTFVNPKTHKLMKQLSIASTDEEMKSTIDNLLN